MEEKPRISLNGLANVLNKFQILEDYFNFDMNDIDLHKIKTCFEMYSKEFNLTEKDCSNIIENYNELMTHLKTYDFDSIPFPYLKTPIMPYIDALFHKTNNIFQNYYLIMLLLANRNFISKLIKNYYFNLIEKNSFGISNKFSNVITKEVKNSDEYHKFTGQLACWYTKIEMIIFYTSILNEYFNVILMFDEKKYSIENNFDFSIKSFAKKSFLRLASFIFKRANLDIKFGSINYNKLFFLIMSSMTCGISLVNIFSNDLRQITTLVKIYFLKLLGRNYIFQLFRC